MATHFPTCWIDVVDLVCEAVEARESEFRNWGSRSHFTLHFARLLLFSSYHHNLNTLISDTPTIPQHQPSFTHIKAFIETHQSKATITMSINQDNRIGWVLLPAIILCCLTPLPVLFRFHTRLRKKCELGWDDWVILGSLVSDALLRCRLVLIWIDRSSVWLWMASSLLVSQPSPFLWL